jgi:hypothetical protein
LAYSHVSWANSKLHWYMCLTNSVAHSKHRVDLIQLVSAKVELLFHTRYISIVEIRTVQIIQEVPSTSQSIDSNALGYTVLT